MRKYILLAVLSAVMILPLASSAAGLVPCNGPTSPGGIGGKECNFATFFELINRLINYAILVAFPITAVVFAYAGWMLLTDQGSGKNVSDAWKLIKGTGTGFVIMLCAWVVVHFLLTKLLTGTYTGLMNSLFKQ